jgi:hypothetical protein
MDHEPSDQDEGNPAVRDHGANDLPTLSETLAPTESEATDACFSSTDNEPSDQDEGNPAVRNHGTNGHPAPSERLASTESVATEAGFSSMDHEPTLNSGESESVSGDPETSSENDPSDGEEIFYFVIDFLKPKLCY